MRLKTYRLLLLFFLQITSFSSVLSHGQEPSSAPQDTTTPTYSLKLDTKLVVLDVVVTDRRGEIVTNLNKDDFQVTEDKEPQTIRSLDKPLPQQPAAHLHIGSTEELDRIAPNAPASILVLDEISTEEKDKAFTLWSLKQYLKSEGDELSQPTMLVAANTRRFMVLRDYTTSKKDLMAALDRHYAGTLWLGALGSLGTKSRLEAGFASLMQIAEASAGHPGHKNIIWIGRGFGNLDMHEVDDPSSRLMPTVRMCTNMMLASRVTLYTVDPVGVAGGLSGDVNGPAIDDHGGPSGDPFKRSVNFESMAWATGGRAYYGRNDVDHLIATSMRDGTSFYTLAYRPTSTSADPKQFRRIHVQVKDRSMTVTTREGYYAGTTRPAPMREDDGKFNKRFIFDVATALKGLLVYDGVPMTLTRDDTKPDEILVHVKAIDLDWQKTDTPKQRAELTVIVESHDQMGKLLFHSARVLHANALGAPDGGPPTGVIDLPPLPVPTAAPAARIRIVLRADDTGRVGAENLFLIDPNKLHDPATGLTPAKVAR